MDLGVLSEAGVPDVDAFEVDVDEKEVESAGA